MTADKSTRTHVKIKARPFPGISTGNWCRTNGCCKVDVMKEDVSGIELRKPTFVRRGHVVISSLSGDAVKIIIADKKDHQKVVALMQVFRPDAVTVV